MGSRRGREKVELIVVTRKKSVRESPDEPLSTSMSGRRQSVRETHDDPASPIKASGRQRKLDPLPRTDEVAPSTKPSPRAAEAAAGERARASSTAETARPPPPAPTTSATSASDPSTSHMRPRFDLAKALEQARIREVRDVNKEARRLASRAATPRPQLPMGCVPRRAMARREVVKMPLDHREGFVLALIDGETTIRTLVDLSGMPEPEVCAVIERLIALRVIVLS